MNRTLGAVVLIWALLLAAHGMADEWISACDTEEVATWNARLRYYRSLEAAEGQIDCTVSVRVRAFGDPTERKKAWEREGLPLPAPVNDGYFFIREGKTPEIWLNLKKDADGKAMLPDLVLGHELLHVLAEKVPRLADPDLRRTCFEQPGRMLRVKGEGGE